MVDLFEILIGKEGGQGLPEKTCGSTRNHW